VCRWGGSHGSYRVSPKREAIAASQGGQLAGGDPWPSMHHAYGQLISTIPADGPIAGLRAGPCRGSSAQVRVLSQAARGRELGQVVAEPFGRDWVDPLRDLGLRRRLDAGLLSEGMLHAVEQLHVGPDCSRDRQRR
jgi:hypothetical protein